MTLEQHSDRLLPVRGLVLARNNAGRRFAATDIARWIRLNRTVFKTEKIDFLGGEKHLDLLEAALDTGAELDCRLSLRAAADTAPPDFADLKAKGLFDVFCTPVQLESSPLSEWLEAAAKAELPVRLQLHSPLDFQEEPFKLAQRFHDSGVVAVNLAAYDPFVNTRPGTGAEASKKTLDRMTQLATALEIKGIETALVHIPPEYLPEKHRHRAVNGQQFFRDHQQYHLQAYQWAERLWEKSPVMAGKIISIVLGRHTLIDDPIDRKLLPWLLESPWLRARVVAWHRVTRHLRLTRAVPVSAIDTEEAYEAALKKHEARIEARNQPADADFQAAMPGLQPVETLETPAAFDLPPSPEHLKYYDEVDRARLQWNEDIRDRAEEALRVIEGSPPDRDIDSFDYKLEGQWCHQLPGGVRWHGFTNSEKMSTPLATLEPPFTLSVVFGGGIAEYIGFSFGRDAKILCSMEGYGHRLVLHVDAEGRYVLLRDGKPVRPAVFEGNYYAPLKLGSHLEPRISIWNIDNSIVTQNVALWSEALRRPEPASKIRYSIVTVCVRYARRLQAVLQSVLHQEGLEPGSVEIIVAYVPGVDTTEDLLDSIAEAHPEVHVRRATFTEGKARAKGFIINEALQKASGEWVLLLDGDTMIPPNLFQEIEKAPDDAAYLVPDGRKLLNRDTTARVLLGEIRPWECWEELLSAEGEFRYREMDGVPIGFCQIVKRECFDKVKYYEVDHFEGADWQFSLDMREAFGPETRLSGVPVLHLDHGGSKWYGTTQHF